MPAHSFARFVPVVLAAGLAAASLARGSTITYTTVGAYNTNNNVTVNATGDALSSTNANDVAGFTTAVSSAYSANTGGVVNFEQSASNNSVTGMVANYGASQSKSLSVTPSVTMSDQTFSQSTPSSGTYGLLPATGNGSSESFTFGTITGGSTGEAVQQFGVVLLGRGTNANYPLAVTVTANLGSGATQTLTASVSSTNGHNAFYGFTAPANDYFTGFSTSAQGNASSDQRVIIDDLGFITGTATPEPASLALMGLAGAALLCRRRTR